MSSDNLTHDNAIIKEVGNGGGSGIIYIKKMYIGSKVKIIIPSGDGGIDEIVHKIVGRGKFCGVLYVHKKHLGKTVKIEIREKTSLGVGISARDN